MGMPGMKVDDSSSRPMALEVELRTIHISISTSKDLSSCFETVAVPA